MKKLLIGLLALGSISAFSSEIIIDHSKKSVENYYNKYNLNLDNDFLSEMRVSPNGTSFNVAEHDFKIAQNSSAIVNIQDFSSRAQECLGFLSVAYKFSNLEQKEKVHAILVTYPDNEEYAVCIIKSDYNY